MRQFLITVGGVLVGLLVFLVIGPIVAISMLMSGAEAPRMPGQTVLNLDLRAPITDQRAQSPFAAFSPQGPALLDIIERLEAASQDRRVRGLVIRANTIGMAPAHAEELRTAIAAFRQSGRFVVAHIQNDTLRQSLAGYAAVAGADEVWLQGAGEMAPMGLSAENLFLGDTLRRFRVQPQFESREEYKSFANVFTETRMTPAQREETQALMQGVYGVLTSAIAQSRRLTPQAAAAAIEATPLTAERAVALRLADRIGRPEDAERAALTRAGEDAEIVDLRDYHPAPRTRGPVIAVIGGEGSIVSGPAEVSPFADSAIMNSDVISRALIEAGEDEDVRAIVFRVSSGGGSVVASDQILAALQRVRQEHNRPIVVSMGEVAASGGYYVAAGANEIVANATSITGSIGVVGGKIVLGPALEHYASVRTERLDIGSPLIGMLSADTPFSAAERTAFSGFIDRAYQEFLARVAAGRSLTVAQVREVARGRVWTGAQARERRLVDHVGGFSTAVQRARALAGIEADERVRLRYYPRQLSPLEQLQAMLGSTGAEAGEAAAMARLMRDHPHLAEALHAFQRSSGVRAESGAPRIR